MSSDIQAKIDAHCAVLRTLQSERGLFLASAKGVSTGYDKAWLRDNFYTCLAFEKTGQWDVVQRCWRALLDVLVKHKEKIAWATKHRPLQTWQYIHARYNPETFEEFWEEWGNKQNDAVGAILFKLGDLEASGHGVVSTDEDKEILNLLVKYVGMIEYWHDPDSGMWEENEEVHASSVGAVLAGLKSVKRLSYVTVPDDYIRKGEHALYNDLLPRESFNKFADLAQLSLFYPYDLLPGHLSDHVLENIEYHLTKDRGVIRYKLDRYYNRNKDGYSEEAEWTMGLSWLSIIYARRGNLEKADYYLAEVEKTITKDGLLPELYYANSEKFNDNTPLGWSESLYVVALLEVAEAHKGRISKIGFK
jgi:phosphorylase kinase alpha/beta subunit